MENHNETAQLEAEIREQVQTRFNVITGMVEYSKDNGKNYQPMTDRMEKNILRILRGNGHKIGVNTVRNIIYSDFSPAYNPFELYFKSLDEWDGQFDYIEQLCSVVDVKNNTYWKQWVTKWLAGVVVSVLTDKVNHQFLALTGGQGIGKTTFLEHLVPTALKNYSNSGYLNPDSKDALIQASECMLINIDELSSLSSKNIESFKQLMTQKSIRVRKPYGYNPENLVRRTSFCGSTNEEQFLLDYTGNRRFLCFGVTDIDLDKLATIDMDKVYAQVLSLVDDGFQYWFSKEDNALIEENNKGFVIRTDIDDAIIDRFEAVSRDEVDNYITMTATGVMSYLASIGLLSNSRRSSQLVGKSLVKLGFERYKSNGSMLYVLKHR